MDKNKTVKNFNHGVRVKYNTEWREYFIAVGDQDYSNAEYYTGSRRDALNTAIHLVTLVAKRGVNHG